MSTFTSSVLQGYYHAFLLKFATDKFSPSCFPSGILDPTAADIHHIVQSTCNS